MVNLTIDGVEVAVEPGTNLIEAAYKAGVVIPHFCYHPKLPVAGNCRMCLVEVEGMRKPEIACNTGARDGMVVHTSSEKVQGLRKAVLEFLFLNHPLDCPICDKAGECKLQDYYLEHGQYTSRLDEGKVRKPKRLDIGTHVVLDTERCVLCSRCVRFTDEIAKTGELRIFERGAHSQIGIYPGRRLENRYSMCVTDLCPVGALTSKEFRFQSRVWYLEKGKSVCGGCANGCNIDAFQYRGKIRRFMPRRNDAVNDTWICDDGRLSFRKVQEENRLLEATQGGAKEELLSQLRGRVEELVKSGEGKRFGFVLSPQASLEENFLMARLAKKAGGQLFLVGGAPVGAPSDDEDGFLIRSDKNPNSRGAQLVASQFSAKNPGALLKAIEDASVAALFVINNDLIGKAKEAGVNVAGFDKLKLLVTASASGNATVEKAHFGVPIGTYLESDGSWINYAGRVQKLERIVDPPEAAWAGWEFLIALESAFGDAATEKSAGDVFNSMTKQIADMQGMTIEKLGEAGLPLEAKASAA